MSGLFEKIYYNTLFKVSTLASPISEADHTNAMLGGFGLAMHGANEDTKKHPFLDYAVAFQNNLNPLLSAIAGFLGYEIAKPAVQDIAEGAVGKGKLSALLTVAGAGAATIATNNWAEEQLQHHNPKKAYGETTLTYTSTIDGQRKSFKESDIANSGSRTEALEKMYQTLREFGASEEEARNSILNIQRQAEQMRLSKIGLRTSLVGVGGDVGVAGSTYSKNYLLNADIKHSSDTHEVDLGTLPKPVPGNYTPGAKIDLGK